MGGQQTASVVPDEEILHGKQLEFDPALDRVKIVDFINAKGNLIYFIRQDRSNDYLKSLLALVTLLTHNPHLASNTSALLRAAKATGLRIRKPAT